MPDDATPAPVAKKPRIGARAKAAKSAASEALQAQDEARKLASVADEKVFLLEQAEAHAAYLARRVAETRAAADAARTRAEELSQAAVAAVRR